MKMSIKTFYNFEISHGNIDLFGITLTMIYKNIVLRGFTTEIITIGINNSLTEPGSGTSCKTSEFRLVPNLNYLT